MSEKFQPVAWQANFYEDEWVNVTKEIFDKYTGHRHTEVRELFTAAQMRQARIDGMERVILEISLVDSTDAWFYIDVIRALIEQESQ